MDERRLHTCPKCGSRNIRPTVPTNRGVYWFCDECRTMWHEDQEPLIDPRVPRRRKDDKPHN